jgi:hypothetical protein
MRPDVLSLKSPLLHILSTMLKNSTICFPYPLTDIVQTMSSHSCFLFLNWYSLRLAMGWTTEGLEFESQ